MTWVLFVWIGYAASHSTIIQHGPFKSESDCKLVGEQMIKELATHNSIRKFSCAPKEKL